MIVRIGVLAGLAASLACAQPTASVKVNPLRDAYYGDLHLHTTYSFDAYVNGIMGVGPDEVYRFAKGETVNYLGGPVRRREPLDFLALTDHSESLGVFNQLEDLESAVSKSDLGKAAREDLVALRAIRRNPGDEARRQQFQEKFSQYVRDYFYGGRNKLPQHLKAESAAAWRREIDLANRHYAPGKFTTFIGYEWTATPYGANLHRNVIFRGDWAPYPFTSLDSKKPEDLWTWLEDIRRQGHEALAIPHNANMSNGSMYDWIDSDAIPIGRAYAERRLMNEPVSEIAQNKGTSETHPSLSTDDEFADFEILDRILGVPQNPSRPQGSYVRDALSRGLVLQRRLGINPYKFGFIGASDLHTGLTVSAEADYSGDHSRLNMGNGKPSRDRAATILCESGPIRNYVRRTGSAGLTGVWAESNTRESIYAALRRRETFVTSGTKLKLRFFGGWHFGKELLEQKDWIAAAYTSGMPMGGDLPAQPDDVAAPEFAVWAVKDESGAPLDRVQIVKVWEENDNQREKIFDVVWSGNRKPDPSTGKLPAVGNTVDLETGHFTNSIGAVELKAVWQDPQFDPRHCAAYYLRVLEIPTPRWSTLLAIESGLPPPEDVPATVQERGWSSPIWFTPPPQEQT